MFSAFVRRDRSQQALGVAANGDVRVWGLGEQAGEVQLLHDEVANRELRHNGVSPLFGGFKGGAEGWAGILFVMMTCEV